MKEFLKETGRTLRTIGVGLLLAGCDPNIQTASEVSGERATTGQKAKDVSDVEENIDFKAEFNRQASEYAEKFATAVISQYEKDKGTGFIYRHPDGKFASINVSYNAPTALKGKFGEYGLAVDVASTQDGEWDPSTVKSIGAYMNNNVSGKRRAVTEQDRVNLYYLSLIENDQGEWNVAVCGMDEVSQKIGWIKMESYTAKDKKDVELLSTLTAQADTILEDTKKKAKVDYIKLPAHKEEN